MHFVVATPYYPMAADPTSGNFIQRQALALAARGHRVDVVHIQPRPLPLRRLAARWRARLAVPDHERSGGVQVFRARYLSTIQRPSLRRFQAGAVARAVERVLRRHPELAAADVVYAQWLVPFGYGAFLAARRAGLRCMVIARGADLNLWSAAPALRRQLLTLLAEADAVLGNGSYVPSEIARLAGGTIARPIDVVYNPCDLGPFLRIDRDDRDARRAARRALGLPADAPLVLFVGALDARKGLDTIVDALAELRAPWRLVAAGSGALAPRLRAAHVTGRVHALGALPHAVVPELMAACDVLALPSRREGLPNAVVEALAAALPVVATPVGGTPEVVVGGVTGWLVPPARPHALAAAIAEAGGDAREARRRGLAGRALVRRLFDVERNVARLEAIVARLGRARTAGEGSAA
jgi:glycosyltransferase involved in cell wall biosynthesis